MGLAWICLKSGKRLIGLVILFYAISNFMVPTYPAFCFNPSTEDGHVGIIREALKDFSVTLKDGTVLKFSPKALRQFFKGNEFTDDPVDGEFDAAAHFDSNQLRPNSKRLIDLKNKAVALVTQDAPDGKTARWVVGRAMHTLQDFYAHSNWVQSPGLGNTDTCKKLGLEEIENLSIWASTCDVETHSQLVDEGLTSITTGFFPYVFLMCNCFHGLGPVPGINQDDASKPFFQQARALAVKATTEYINQIIQQIGDNDDALKVFFDCPGSIGFVIDSTESMYDDIDYVETVVDMIINFLEDHPDMKPDKYIFVEFNDPYVGEAWATTNVALFRYFVNSIIPDGGGDCPEYCFTGILRAVKACSPGGRLYVFSDASAKDDLVANLARHSASKKNIKISFVTTGSCSPIDPEYFKTAESTGGQLFEMAANDIPKIFDVVAPGLSSDLQPIILVNDTLKTGAVQSYIIPVDSTVSTLVVSVNMEEKGTIALIRPGGGAVASGDADANVNELPNGTIFKIDTPGVGAWQLNISGNAGVDFSLSANGISAIDFSQFEFVHLVEQRGYKAYFPIAGTPVLGADQIARAIVLGVYGTVGFHLISESGKELKALSLIRGNQYAGQDDLIGGFRLPGEAFRIQALGKDISGNDFMRVFPALFQGQSIKWDLVEVDKNVFEGKPFKTILKLSNFGSMDTFGVSCANVDDSSISISPKLVTVNTNGSADIEATYSVPDSSAGTDISLTFFATSNTDPDTKNSITMTRSISVKPTAFVAFTNIPDGAANVALDSIIQASFSMDMDGGTITSSTFSADNGLSGTVSFDSPSNIATLTPASGALKSETTYTITISSDVKDSYGDGITPYTWSFTTSGSSGTGTEDGGGGGGGGGGCFINLSCP